jgi:hypothetical protein
VDRRDRAEVIAHEARGGERLRRREEGLLVRTSTGTRPPFLPAL